MKDEWAFFGHKVDPQRDDVLYLCLDRFIRIDGARNHLLSFDLRTESDIDQAIDELGRQLAAAGKRAKAALKERRRKSKAN